MRDRGRADPLILDELLKVLEPHPGGLRRWSVMRAIRSGRDRNSRPVSLKFEDEVERVFRSFCTDAGDAGVRELATDRAFFYRPEGKAGEVWAVHRDRAKAWLDGSLSELD